MAGDGIRSGERVPDFSLRAANRNEEVSLRGLLARGPVVIEFLRGTWWPNCVKRMAQLEPYKEEISKLGASLVYIAAEKRRGMFHPEKFLAEHPISFPFLLDEDRQVTRAYGVYHRLGLDAFNIARPATFVADSGGVARFAYVGMDQKDRAPIEAVLQVLRGLAGAGPQK